MICGIAFVDYTNLHLIATRVNYTNLHLIASRVNYMKMTLVNVSCYDILLYNSVDEKMQLRLKKIDLN